MDPGLVKPIGFPRQPQVTLLGAFRPGIASGNMAGGFTTVLPHKLCRRPDKIAQVRNRFDENLPDSAKWDPVVAPFKNYLENGTQSFIGVRDPLEIFPIYFAGAHRRRIERLVTQLCPSLELALAKEFRRLRQ